MKIKVQNMRSNSGNDIANQFHIITDKESIFQSYSITIAVKRLKDGQITLNKDYWDYSVTTGKYRNLFLGEGIAETRSKIQSGEYKLKDLN